MYEFMYEYPKRTQANDVTYKRSERKRCLRVIRKIYLLNFLAAANRNISVVNLNFSVLPIMDRQIDRQIDRKREKGREKERERE